MFPKEHGAWNALLVSLFAGWIGLDQWNPVALAATLIWFSGFVLRAPTLTFLQYRKADQAKARKALVFAILLLVALAFSTLYFFRNAPQTALSLVLFLGLPIGVLICGIAVIRRNLRLVIVEVLGFAGICLLAPVLALCSPLIPLSKAFWLYGLFGGYFILAIFYIKVRQKWVALMKDGIHSSLDLRMEDGAAPLLLHALFVGAVYWANPWMALGPLWALGRVLAGVMGGKPDLPIMRLGVREMIHSLVYLILVMGAWKVMT